MKCPRCGLEAKETKVCSRCGADFNADEQLEVEYKVFKVTELLEIGPKQKTSDPEKSDERRPSGPPGPVSAAQTTPAGPVIGRATAKSSRARRPRRSGKTRTFLVIGVAVIVLLLLIAGLFFLEQYLALKF